MSKSETNRTRILEAPIGRTLVQLTIPMVFGILSMVLYNLADTYFIGQLGKEHLAAMSFTFPVVMMIGSLAQGIGLGASAAVSRAIGSNDHHRVKRLATDSLVLGVLIILLGVTAGLLSLRPLFQLLGADGIVLDYVIQYMRIWYFGMVFVVVPMIGNNILRATGDTKTPGMVMMLGALANFILDPLLIFGFGPIPALGIRGAATATVVGRGMTFVVFMYLIIRRERLLSFATPSVREVLGSWREILHVGIPDAGARMIIPLGQGVITRVIAGYGAAAVAGFGLATRVDFFSLAALSALAAVIAPFTGQNLGAKKIERVKRGFLISRNFSLIFGSSLFVVYLAMASTIAGLFTSDPAVIATATLYIRIVSVAYAFQGIYLVCNAGLNVLKRPFHAMGLSLLELFGLAIPLALLGSRFFGLAGIFTAIGTSYLITGIAAWLVIQWALQKL